MSIKELKEKSEKELLNLLQLNRGRLCQLKFELSQGKVKNIREIRKAKKEIARILTLMNRNELARPNGRPVPSTFADSSRLRTTQSDGSISPKIKI